jgi:hypothetical protein
VPDALRAGTAQDFCRTGTAYTPSDALRVGAGKMIVPAILSVTYDVVVDIAYFENLHKTR